MTSPHQSSGDETARASVPDECTSDALTDPAGSADPAGPAENAAGPGAPSSDDDRWLVIDGRRWRRTDPSLPADVVEALTSHLGKGRSGVRAGKKAGDDERVAAARRRVGLAKAGLGERGPYWWDEPEPARLARAREALRDLDALDEHPARG